MNHIKKMFRILKEKMKVKHVVGLILLTVLFILGSYVVYMNEITPRMTAAYTVDPVPQDTKSTKMKLVSGEKIVQNFIFPKDQMSAIGVTLYSLSDHNKGNLELKVYDNTTNELLGASEFDTSKILDMSRAELEDYSYFNVNMGALLSGNENRAMRVELEVGNLSKKSQVYIYTNDNNPKNQTKVVDYESNQAQPQIEPAVVTGAQGKDNVSIAVRGYCYQYAYWKLFWKMGNVVVYIMLFLSYIALIVIKAKLHHVFLIVGTALAICYTFLLPPLTVPDELVHITTSYYYSNHLLGIKEPADDSIYIRRTDLQALSILKSTPDLKEYDYFMWNILRSPKSTELISYDRTQESKNWLLYIPTILGITLARLIGTNGITLLFIGRAFAVFTYLAIMYFAIKKMPIVKGAFFLLAISPMVLQQSISFSYDALPIILSFLFVAELFSLLYKERKIKRWDYILIAIILFFLASSKGGVYIPECLLVLLIPKDRFEKANGKRHFVLGMIAVIILGFIINTIPYLLLVFGLSGTTTTTQKYSDSLNCYSVGDVLLHPIHTIYVLINTLLMYIDFYFEGIMAGPLGWLNISINPFWAYGLSFLMFLGIVPAKNEKLYIEKRQRIAFAFAILVTVAMTVASMFVSWTSKGNLTVSGLQGRYFTPIFFLLIFTLRSKLIKLEHNIDYVLVFLGIAINTIILDNILSSIQAVM